jgi:phosphopantothenoylcysteine decarboxylase/phosphopantothenate--cysteine ligase
MDGDMVAHPAVVANLNTLVERGATVIEPEEGRFASGLVGKGRLPDTPTLMGYLRRVLGRDGALAGRRIVVSAGGTREPLDPVRYLTNHSSGKQGYAIAQAALDAGASVTLVSAATHLSVPVGLDFVPVETAQQLHDAILHAAQAADALVMAAAVADYRPATVSEQKIKKQLQADETLTVPLTRNPDILLAVYEQRQHINLPRVVVGFAAESENLLANAQSKLERKGLDMLVANDITAPDAGFNVDTNRVTLLYRDGYTVPLDLTSKANVAETVVAEVARLLG